MERAEEGLRRAEGDLGRRRREVERLEATAARRRAWDDAHGWRLERVAALDDALAHHWAGAVLAVVREGDPLAFGVEHLRGARATCSADMAALDAALPPDTRWALARVEAELEKAQGHLARAHAAVGRAEGRLAEADRRRWGRRDRAAVAEATTALRTAEAHAGQRTDRVDEVARRVAEGRRAAVAWAAVLEATVPARGELSRALRDLDSALATTRPERVAALADAPPEHLRALLGDLPTTRGGQRAWCGLAEEVEAQRDRHGDGHGALWPEARRSATATGPLVKPQPADGSWGRHATTDHAAVIRLAGELDPAPAPALRSTDSDAWAAEVCEARRDLEAVWEAARAAPAPERGLGLGVGW